MSDPLLYAIPKGYMRYGIVGRAVATPLFFLFQHLSPDHPKERIRIVLEHARMKRSVYDRHGLVNQFPPTGVRDAHPAGTEQAISGRRFRFQPEVAQDGGAGDRKVVFCVQFLTYRVIALRAWVATLSGMGAIYAPKPVNLICGLISNDPDLMARAIRMMKEHMGPTDEVSPLYPFDMTEYYIAEMGEDLQRQFVSFEKLIQPDEIVYLKTLTNQIETRIVRDLALPEDRRLVNLDPGYITLGKLVLATTKDFSHRVYLRDGIYAESTLRYAKGQWLSCPWTFPDYADGRYHAFFDRVRERFKEKLAKHRSREELKP